MDVETARSVLGVSADSSLQQIRKTYRTKARTLHPDTAGSDQGMSELNQAYRELTQHAESKAQNTVISGGALGALPVGGHAHHTAVFASTSTAQLPVKLGSAAAAREQTILTFRTSSEGPEVQQKLWIHEDPRSGENQLTSMQLQTQAPAPAPVARASPVVLSPAHFAPGTTTMPLSHFAPCTTGRECSFPDVGASSRRVPF